MQIIFIELKKVKNFYQEFVFFLIYRVFLQIISYLLWVFIVFYNFIKLYLEYIDADVYFMWYCIKIKSE